MRWSWLVVAALGCRTYHTPLPFNECQPFDLQCERCTFEADAEEPLGLDRVWRCVTDDDRVVDAVRHRSTEVNAWDTRYYLTETGTRIAALREWDSPIALCGEEVTDEWYGEILDCVDDCEHEPDLDGADPDLPLCGPVL